MTKDKFRDILTVAPKLSNAEGDWLTISTPEEAEPHEKAIKTEM